MRNTNKDKRIFSATRDYYNDRGGRIDQLAYHLTGRKQLRSLTEGEHSDLWAIRTNMTDEIYMRGIMGLTNSIQNGRFSQ